MTFEEFSEKLKKLAVHYRNSNLLEDKELQAYSQYLDSGDKATKYTLNNNEVSDNPIRSYSVYESDSDFLNNKLINISNTQKVYIKTNNDLYLKSSDDGILSLESNDNLENTFKWTIKIDKIDNKNTNSVQIYDFKEKKIKVAQNKHIQCQKSFSSRFTQWKLKKYNKYFVLESFKYKNYHIDSSNISKLVYDIPESSKWIIIPINQSSIKKKPDVITGDDEKKLNILETNFKSSLEKINNYNLTLSYLEQIITKTNQLNIQIILDNAQETTLNNKLDNTTDLYTVVKTELEKLEDILKNNKAQIKKYVQSINSLKDKKKSESNKTLIQKSITMLEKILNDSKKKIPDLERKIEEKKEELSKYKPKEISSSYNNNLKQQEEQVKQKEQLLKILKTKKNMQIDSIKQEVENLKNQELDVLKNIKSDIEKMHKITDIQLKNKESEYNSSKIENEIELSKYDENIDNELDYKIDKIREDKDILNNNIEYLIKSDKYFNTKKNTLLIFISLLSLVGVCILISLFINIYISLN